jgi:hypothetical protein
LRIALFGGTVTEPQSHNKYTIQRESLDKKFSGKVEIDVLDERSVCGQIPRTPQGPWLDGLRNNNIWLSDLTKGSADIDILVGSDCMGHIITGRIIQLRSGLTATETLLGWTIYGKTSKYDDSVATLITPNFVSEASVEELGYNRNSGKFSKPF